MKRVKKRYIISALLVFFIFLAIVTNPTEQDYINHTNFEELFEDYIDQGIVEIERKNFYLFSTYAPKFILNEYGIVYLGFMGNFFQISEGQFSYPWWLSFFN